jgi:hypothetical protein
MKKKERLTKFAFLKRLVQAYLIVSMDMWGLDRRYSGVDHKYESKN